MCIVISVANGPKLNFKLLRNTSYGRILIKSTLIHDDMDACLAMLMKFFLYGQAAADAKFYGNVDVYNILKARGAKVPVRY